MPEQFDAGSAAFDAFAKRPGGVLTRLVGGYLLAILLAMAGLAALFWGAVVDYMRWAADLGAGGAAMPPASLIALIPIYFLVLPFFVVLAAAFEAGVLRWLVRGERAGGLLGINVLAGDTWRIVLVYVLMFIAHVVVVSLAAGLTVGIVMALEPAGVATRVLASVAIGFAAFAGYIYFAVRLAPLAAVTVARGSLGIGAAWSASRGRFWALFLAFVIVLVVLVVAQVVLGIVQMVAMAIVAAPTLASGAAEDPMAAMGLMGPVLAVSVIFGLIGAVAGILYNLTTMGVNAKLARVAYPQNQAEAFS